MRVKERAKKLHVTQAELSKILCLKGEKVAPSELNIILNEYLNTPKAKRILFLCEQILDECEEALKC